MSRLDVQSTASCNGTSACCSACMRKQQSFIILELGTTGGNPEMICMHKIYVLATRQAGHVEEVPTS